MALEPPHRDEERSYPPSEADLRAFYQSQEWKRLAFQIKCERGRICECCGAKPEDGVRIVSDHIKPVRFYWHLRLTETNIQNLCDDCNHGKGSHYEINFSDLPGDATDPTSLKQAIIHAYSFGQIRQDVAIQLIGLCGLVSA